MTKELHKPQSKQCILFKQDHTVTVVTPVGGLMISLEVYRRLDGKYAIAIATRLERRGTVLLTDHAVRLDAYDQYVPHGILSKALRKIHRISNSIATSIHYHYHYSGAEISELQIATMVRKLVENTTKVVAQCKEENDAVEFLKDVEDCEFTPIDSITPLINNDCIILTAKQDNLDVKITWKYLDNLITVDDLGTLVTKKVLQVGIDNYIAYQIELDELTDYTLLEATEAAILSIRKSDIDLEKEVISVLTEELLNTVITNLDRLVVSAAVWNKDKGNKK